MTTKSLTGTKFIVFEGLDGSGKSTCARRAAEALGATFLTTPSPTVRRYRDDLVESLGGSQEARQLFYLATVFAASHEITAHQQHGESVVLDRYFLSTQCYAAFRGSQLQIDEVGHLLRPADLTVYLDAPLELRRARLAARGMSAADRETLTPAADERLRSLHLTLGQHRVAGRLLVLDAARLTPDEVVGRVLEAL